LDTKVERLQGRVRADKNKRLVTRHKVLHARNRTLREEKQDSDTKAAQTLHEQEKAPAEALRVQKQESDRVAAGLRKTLSKTQDRDKGDGKWSSPALKQRFSIS
jgi:hypothetical protein